MNTGIVRTRWVAIGLAIGVILGAGGLGMADATTSSGERSIFQTVEPCRLADTRPQFQVGPRSTPLGANETYTLAGWGTVGNCSLPTGTTGLALNVTPVSATLPTFLTIFPADQTLPLASHLNPNPGQPPTPNAVNVDLDQSGEFNVYNLQGTVHIVIDVVGYYDHHTHDDRYYTEAEVDQRLAAAKSIIVSRAGDQQEGIETPTFVLIGTPAGETVRSVMINTPAAGTIAVNATLSAQGTEPGRGTPGACSITLTNDIEASAQHQFDLDENEDKTVALTRAFDVTAGSSTINLVCRTYATFHNSVLRPTSMDIFDSSIVATFVPD